MIPIIGNILQNTIGKVIGGVVNKYLPASMSDKEKADMELEIQKLLMEEKQNDILCRSVIYSENS